MTDYTVFRPADPVADLVDDYEIACAEFDKAKENKDRLAETLASHFPDFPGDHTRVFGKKIVTVAIPEKWTWEQDVMEALFAGTKTPDYVTHRMSVPRKAYEKLSQPDQDYLKPALTRGPGSPKIKIEVAKEAI